MDGYEVPLHRSLTEPILMAGAPRAAAIAIGTLAMTLLFMGLMVYTMHGALKELRVKQSSREDGNGCEQEHEAESLLVSWDGAKQQPPSPRLRISDGHVGDRAWGDTAV